MQGINKFVTKGVLVNDGIVTLQTNLPSEPSETPNPHLKHGRFILDHSAVRAHCENHKIPYPQRSGPAVQVLLADDRTVKTVGRKYLAPGLRPRPWVPEWEQQLTDISGVCTVMLVAQDPSDTPGAQLTAHATEALGSMESLELAGAVPADTVLAASVLADRVPLDAASEDPAHVASAIATTVAAELATGMSVDVAQEPARLAAEILTAVTPMAVEIQANAQGDMGGVDFGKLAALVTATAPQVATDPGTALEVGLMLIAAVRGAALRFDLFPVPVTVPAGMELASMVQAAAAPPNRAWTSILANSLRAGLARADAGIAALFRAGALLALIVPATITELATILAAVVLAASMRVAPEHPDTVQVYVAQTASALTAVLPADVAAAVEALTADMLQAAAAPAAPAVAADKPPRIKVAAIIHQVIEEEITADIHRLYGILIQQIREKTVSQGRTSHTNGQRFYCVGKVFIQTDRTSVSPGYRKLKGQCDDALIAEMADTIWKYACGIAPFLAKYKADGLKGEHPELLLGRSGWNVYAIAHNACVELHLDSKDGLWSIIIWIHTGKGAIEGGAFCLPGFGVRFIPGTLTMAILNARDYVHGTAPLTIPAGSSAKRWGSSFFLRVRDLQQLMELQEGLEEK
ncbi:hypothetical protein Vretimale_14281, partial [Volvox reticuliferus]